MKSVVVIYIALVCLHLSRGRREPSLAESSGDRGLDRQWSHTVDTLLTLCDYRQAARTQVIIAKQEQEQGNYKVAHKLLHDTFKELESQNVPVGRGLEEALMLLHSYVLVKMLVKQVLKPACACASARAHVVPGLARP